MKTISVNKLADLLGGTIIEVELASLIEQHYPKKHKIGLGGVLNISYEPFESKECSREGLPIPQQAVTAVAREINGYRNAAHLMELQVEGYCKRIIELKARDAQREKKAYQDGYRSGKRDAEIDVKARDAKLREDLKSAWSETNWKKYKLKMMHIMLLLKKEEAKRK